MFRVPFTAEECPEFSDFDALFNVLVQRQRSNLHVVL